MNNSFPPIIYWKECKPMTKQITLPAGGGRVMTFLEFIKSRRKKAVLFFLAGFFSGGILYYLCQEPAGDALAALEENMVLWAGEEREFFQVFLFILWERGKIFAVLWLAGYTKIYKAYICAFLIYIGLQSGFLLTFFVMVREELTHMLPALSATQSLFSCLSYQPNPFTPNAKASSLL